MHASWQKAYVLCLFIQEDVNYKFKHSLVLLFNIIGWA